jgi:endonuclease/exonuclease/phosphatase family metal-dependent hydrolase
MQHTRGRTLGTWMSMLACGLTLAPVGTTRADSPFRDELPHISWSEAPNHYGQECIVYGKVVTARDIGSRCFLNFHRNYRENFTVVINSRDYDKFAERPDVAFRGKNVRVVGKIIEFKNKPEIVVAGPDAIEIVDSPDPPAGANKTAPPAPATDEPAAAEAAQPSAPAPPPLANGIVRIATFNMLNLFDDFDDPYVANERVPGKRADEVARLGKTLRRLRADVVAVQEIENRQVLDAFVDKYLGDYGYEVVLFEGNSDRGIDVGLLSRVPIDRVTSHRHRDFPDGRGKTMRFRRDLLQVRLAPRDHEPFDVFVVHLKSKHGGAEKSLPIRLGEAREIRRCFDGLLAIDPQSRFVICGDFNDTIESEPLKAILGQGATALRGFYEDLAPEQRITFNRNHLSMIDFILASPTMADAYVPKSYEVLLGSVDSCGSDHNPVVAAFTLTPRTARN